VELFQLKN